MIKVAGLSPVILVTTLIAYLAVLFWLARIADRRRYNSSSRARHPLIYALALGVYCTSWTFYGLVGTAAARGWYYLPILLGPILLFTLGYPLLQRIARICHQENLHSIADFIASRYGKRQAVAVVVTVLILFATVPYIALQLKAVSDALVVSISAQMFSSQDLTLVAALSMIAFALLFGANRLDVASYHSGIMVAIAFESLIKLIALVSIAIFALFLSQGFDLTLPNNAANKVFLNSTVTPSFWVLTLVSGASIFCLPRMFQVTFVECLSENHLRFARKSFTLYMVLIALAVFVIAWVGNQLLSGSDVSSDTYVLALPLLHNNKTLGLLAFIGGFSAATAMIIVATLTLSQMLSNDVILPLVIRAQKNRAAIPDYSRSLKLTRRSTVVAIIGLAWLYQHSLAENAALTEIGLIAFALVVQLAPAILFGIYWQRANAIGVFAGLAAGTLIWFVTLMIPLLINAGMISGDVASTGILGIEWLRPTHLFGLEFSDNYTRGVVLSLVANVVALYWVSTFDLTRLPDHIQAIAFINRERTKQDSSVQGLRINRMDLASLLQQFLGKTATDRLLENAEGDSHAEGVHASNELLKNAEQALSGIIGVASTRAMLVSLSSGESLGVADVVNIFEETTRTLQFNQDMLFASFESISSAISVVNADLKMVAWNKRYEQMFNYPKGMLRVGRHVADLVRFNAERGMLGAGSVEQHVQTRLDHLLAGKPYRVVRNHNEGVIEIKGRPLPNGGYVTTYDDITEFIDAQNELEKANLNLEQRVHERTEQIENINRSLREEIRKREETEQELIRAKSLAESANANKTQFLASASHDILQPLNAANLYASALLERPNIAMDLSENLQHLHNAIGSAEFIISNLLEISRLDTGALKPQVRCFALDEVLEPLTNEFRVQTRDNVEFIWHPTRLWTESDPKFLRRILQNFVANAVKYTEQGKILLGCRRREDCVEIGVYDTGPGISEAHQQRIFDDFYRIRTEVEGAGLGLGIAQRFSQLLNHKLHVKSYAGHGSVFSVIVPLREPLGDEPPKTVDKPHTSGLEDLHVFYVDDDENNIHALKTLMQNWGCKLSSASSVARARASSAQQGVTPDALLLDYQLDENTNGIDLALELREAWGSLPVCVVSAAPDDTLSAALAEHHFDFLRKPIKPSKLRALMERYSGRHR
ncbi:Na+/proline symporter [Alteromonadaceae bacterium 2753L.S.0a.02]|nr:Na+/proline symporter [Alteromonadaceae bacterium 2753L.S.0a.02]